MKQEPNVIAVDFDGVIHSYTSGWKGSDVISDPPVPGAIDFLSYLVSDGSPARAVIFSSRARTRAGRRAIKDWLREHSGNLWHESMGSQGIESIAIVGEKPIAKVYLDDRAVRFEGAFPPRTHEGIESFVEQKPWNKRTPRAKKAEPVGPQTAEELAEYTQSACDDDRAEEDGW